MELDTLFTLVDALSDEDKQALVQHLTQPHIPQPPSKPRKANLFPGVWMSDDFDAELPDSFWMGEE